MTNAALWFLRGGLVAVVALLVPSQFGFVLRDAPALAPIVALLRVAIPAAGFAIGGAVGGSALGRGRRGVLASAAGLLVTGAALTVLAQPLQGLTGFERPLMVLLFAGVATGTAFAAGGAVASLALVPRRFALMAAGFGAGGAVGGIISVLPSVFAATVAGWPAEAQLFARLACSLAGLLGPFAVAGAVAGRILDGSEN